MHVPVLGAHGYMAGHGWLCEGEGWRPVVAHHGKAADGLLAKQPKAFLQSFDVGP